MGPGWKFLPAIGREDKGAPSGPLDRPLHLQRGWIVPATGRRLSTSPVLLILALVTAAPAVGQQGETLAPRPLTGRISGRVTERGVTPIPSATVRVVGTAIRATTDDHGEYLLADVPVGIQLVQVDALGYGQQTKTVMVSRGAAHELDFEYGESQVVKEIEQVEVRAERGIEPQSSATRHLLSREEFERLPVDDVRQAVGLKAGVVTQGGTLHVRGGRGGEVRYQFDGVGVSDPLVGRGPSIANLAVNDVEVISGGFDAEYGDALSGFVNVNTNEGGEVFAGTVRWDTDRYGEPMKTFDSYDRLEFRLGGPTPLENLTYFLAYEGTFSDTYLRSSLTHHRHALLDFIQLGNRQFNEIKTNLKLAYRSNRQKLTLETINNRTLNTPYNHMWSRQGFVKTTYDTIRAAGEADTYQPRFGTWSFTQLDSTFVPINMPDHVPSTDDRFRQLKLVWTDQLSDQTQWSTRLSLHRFETLQSVGRKNPEDYWVVSPQYWDGNMGPENENNPFFATHGDFPVYARSHSTVRALRSDFATRRAEQHTFQTGFEARYIQVASLDLLLPNTDVAGLRSEFEISHPEGAAYVQHRWEFEGLVLNAGLRYDLFTPGHEIPASELPSGRRYKQQLSPRLGIAYPISTRDVLSLHYGRNFQVPARFYLFDNRGAAPPIVERISVPGGAQGNPDLAPETTIAYQAALQHLFTPALWGQFAVFFKDFYGLLTTRITSDPFGNQIARYVNGDYASARGFEASLVKRFSRRFSTEVNYTYQIVTGVASDPRQAQQFLSGGRLYLPISEQPLDWDQRSTLTMQAELADRGRWGIRLVGQYGSGFPYTPTLRSERRPDPALTNSGKLPSTSTLTIGGERNLHICGLDVTVLLDVRNALNATNVASPTFSLFPNPILGQVGDEYLIYFTETGRVGGAYLQDVDGDRVLDWVPIHDPRALQEGRQVRMGIRVDF